VKISKEFIIGLIVTVTLALLYWGFNFLKGEDVFTNDRVFYAVYADVGGLTKANPVSINGLNVGQVRDMYFLDNQSSQVIIEMMLTNPIPIPKNSIAKIVSSDLLGSKGVEINLGNSIEMASPGDTLVPEVEISIKDEVNRTLQPLKTKAEDLMLSIDTVITMLQNLFNKSNRDNLSETLQHISNSFANLENATGRLDTLLYNQQSRLGRIMVNIESITSNLNDNQDEFNNIIANFSSLSDTLAKARVAETLLNTNQTMLEISVIMQKINSGQGSMGMLVNDDSLYIELEKSAKDLNLLLEDIRNNPKKYVKVSVF